MTHSGKTVIVIGGGLAGLATATLLSDRGFQVTLIEQKHRLGGRTFSFQDRTTSDVVDNGQHILMGCYHYTLRWLKFLGQAQPTQTGRLIHIPFAAPHKKLSSLIIPVLPMPMHLLVGILRFKNLSFWERLLLIKAGLKLPFQHIPETISVDDWLKDLGQNENLKTYFWNPVCLAVMNESLQNASAKLFATALKHMFLVKGDYSRIIIPKTGLSELFVIPSEVLIRQNGGIVLLDREVDKIQLANDQITGITLNNKNLLQADVYVSAVPQSGFFNIIDKDIRDKHFQAMAVLRTSPIISIYVWLTGIQTDQLFHGSFIGCIHTKIQWIFKKSDSLLEITISGAVDMINRQREEIFELIVGELEILFADFKGSMVRHFLVIKERNATFSQPPDSGYHRPSCRTPIKNFYIAGDWTDTGLPATIEGAVKSAYTAVDHVCAEYLR
ncbi:FAD-dependent oxidoreductase [bacterium]|nr:MAG: FAD-dependent oxidoreductase [bacterium]